MFRKQTAVHVQYYSTVLPILLSRQLCPSRTMAAPCRLLLLLATVHGLHHVAMEPCPTDSTIEECISLQMLNDDIIVKEGTSITVVQYE
jgi:hypothetical protein